ncbi:MAG TPA: J domain-containing protein [Polyangia bacterium]|nr:J domain-containing protein [Polyangia bacterium]
MSRPEDQLRDLLRREAFRSDFVDNEPPLRLGRCPPFHPAAVVRNHVEAWLGAEAAAHFRARAGGQRLRLEFPPHPSCLGRDERPLVTLLGLPRSLAELEEMRLVPMTRIERLCAFLEAVGSIVLGPSPYELLGLQDGAPHEEVRRAYKRLARELHPDLHPGATEDDRRELASRFAALHKAYRRLLPGG